MVKFGRHLQFYLDLELEGANTGTRARTSINDDTNRYFVPYNTLRNAIESPNTNHEKSFTTSTSTGTSTDTSTIAITPESFEISWRDALSKSNSDLSESINSCWKSIFDSISSYQQEQEQQSLNNTNATNATTKATHDNQTKKITTRGMELMDAIQVYTQINNIVSSRDLLCFLKDTYNAAEINYQALRKIVKKFDKKYHATIASTHSSNGADGTSSRGTTSNGISPNNSNSSSHNDLLSVSLLPELYSSVLYVGRGTLEMTISYLRELIEELTSTTTSNSSGEEDDYAIGLGSISLGNVNGNSIGKHDAKDETDSEYEVSGGDSGANRRTMNRRSKNLIPPLKNRISQKQKKKDQEPKQQQQKPSALNEHEDDVVKKRGDEIQWLNEIGKKIPHSELKHIVAHRGFHTPQGRSDYRPLENSLSAYETAWSAGIHLCECDVALTKDEKLVLAHDEDFNRLALDRSSTSSNLKVSELTFKELIALTLKNGVRAPLLKDVLISANAISPDAKLVIEIKPGNSEAAMALARLLVKYPELISHIAVIMSFDLWSMHSLSAELRRLFPNHDDANNSNIIQNRSGTTVLGSSPSEKIFHMEASSRRDRSDSLISYSNSQKIILPKLMLLTVADQPENRFELCVDVSDYSPIEGWLNSTHTSLDGVYVRCQPGMLLPEGKAALQKLAEKYTVGVWGKVGEDPDDYRMMTYLVKECNVSFYNTDFPRTF
jgi:glycerophosphoryl diester phosphodiesterase